MSTWWAWWDVRVRKVRKATRTTRTTRTDLVVALSRSLSFRIIDSILGSVHRNSTFEAARKCSKHDGWWMVNGMINGMMRSNEIKWDQMRSNEFWPAKCSWHKVTTAEGMHLCIILFLLPPLLCVQRHETLRWCFRQRDLMTWWLPAYPSPSIIKIRRTYPSGALHQTLLLPTQQEAWGWP